MMHQFRRDPYNPFQAGESMLRLWTDLLSKMMTAPMSFSPASPPPEAAREVPAFFGNGKRGDPSTAAEEAAGSPAEADLGEVVRELKEQVETLQRELAKQRARTSGA